VPIEGQHAQLANRVDGGDAAGMFKAAISLALPAEAGKNGLSAVKCAGFLPSSKGGRRPGVAIFYPLCGQEISTLASAHFKLGGLWRFC